MILLSPRRTALAILLLLLLPSFALADLAPVTPTFLLAFGNAGSGPGQFDEPAGVAIDPLGDVYVVERDGHRVQKFDFVGNLFLAKYRGEKPWHVTNGGLAEANLVAPSSTAADPYGNIYIADTGNHRVLKASTDGDSLLQWGSLGTGDGQFQSPYGIAIDGSSNVYVTDWDGDRVQKFTSAGVYLAQWGSAGHGNGQFNHPSGITIDAAGNVFLTDQDDRVQKFTSSGVFLAQWGASGTANGQLANPTGVAVDALGNVYVADQGNDRVQKFSNAGAYLTQWGSAGAAPGQLDGPMGVAVDAAGNVYVADSQNGRIQKFSGAGVPLSQAPPHLLMQFGGSYCALATDDRGNVFAATCDDNTIEEFAPDGTPLLQWGSTGSGNGQFNDISGLATYPSDPGVLVCDANNHRIQNFVPAGTYRGQFGSLGNNNGQFNEISDIDLDDDDVKYVTDLDGRIQKFGPFGYLGGWNVEIPYSIATDARGRAFVSNQGLPGIKCFTLDGTLLNQWQVGGLNFGVATDPAGEVYVTDGERYDDRVLKYTGAGTLLCQWGPVVGAHSVDVDSVGNVYVTGQGGVYRFVSPPLISQISDIANDQGNQVRIQFQRCAGDAPLPGVTITGYAVYRRIDPLPIAARATTASSAMPSPDLAGWDYVATQPAAGDRAYNMIVPTLANARVANPYYTAFMVRALTTDPLVHFDSAPEYGYSVDNLAPPAPAPFSLASESGGTRLHWDRSPVSDFASFRLYRGADASFVPASSNLVASTADTGYFDAGKAGNCYKLSAVDVNGNESAFALAGPGQITSTPSHVQFALESVRPNPASDGNLLVRFALPAQSPARLELFNPTGRAVVSREVGSLGPGEHTVNLAEGVRLPSGLYFVHLRQGTSEKTTRVIVLD